MRFADLKTKDSAYCVKDRNLKMYRN